MTRSGRSVQDHNWCVWIYEAGVILMVIGLNLNYTFSKNRLIGILRAIVYAFRFPSEVKHGVDKSTEEFCSSDIVVNQKQNTNSGDNIANLRIFIST